METANRWALTQRARCLHLQKKQSRREVFELRKDFRDMHTARQPSPGEQMDETNIENENGGKKHLDVLKEEEKRSSERKKADTL